MCWGLAHAYRALFKTIPCPQGEEKISGSDNKITGTEATPRPVTDTVATHDREGGIDKAIGKGAQALSLWRKLLSGVKERYPFEEGILYHPCKQITMERSIQYLRELDMLEVVYDDLDNEQFSEDPDEVKCT
ncbi:ubiquitin carboxyl-terminal hydrolase 4 [Limosa lapponica baueri]|uniref:Ubiquitin carboxyl-terminal hydrolase 4 n=1 Tax=Limosa lapponica baueri TaxID=1758121 RepID=A0A2I0U6I3_LIMLA|nr:ubiquitin carboxyl-terminal hydrolase 4 [Limosa lapponica baueri]